MKWRWRRRQTAVECPVVLAAALFAAGCVTGVTGGHGPDGAGSPARAPAGSGDGREVGPGGETGELDDEVTRVLPELEPPAAPEPDSERAGRLGLRGGLILPGSSPEESWDTTAIFGLYYRPVRALWPGAAYEVEFDYLSVKRGDGYVTSRLYVLRGGLLFANWDDDGRSSTVFGLAGAEAVIGSSSYATGKEDSRGVAALEFGVGVGPPDGAWDVRAVYSLFLGSDNVKGGLLLAAGSLF